MPTKTRTVHDLRRVKKSLNRRLARVKDLQAQLGHLYGIHPHLVEVARRENEAKAKMNEAVGRAHESHDILNKSRTIGAQYEQKAKRLLAVSMTLAVASIVLALWEVRGLLK